MIVALVPAPPPEIEPPMLAEAETAAACEDAVIVALSTASTLTPSAAPSIVAESM